ncbi:MAG: IS30 family transposase [Raoultibacter sp.]
MQTTRRHGSRAGKTNLTIEDRKKIERYLRGGLNSSEIAREINRSPSTIQKEVARGKCEQIVDPIRYKTEYVYDWYYAQSLADNAASQKGCPRKIAPGDIALKRVTELIKARKPKNYSPYAALTQAAHEKQLPVRICVSTLYAYIHSGEYGLNGMNLLRPNAKRKDENCEKREAKNRPAELSIDNRPKRIIKRNEFGHWEGDLVCSPTKCNGTAAVFTLLERKTRKYIAIRIPSKSPQHVKKALDLVEKWLGDLFSAVVKTITFDNGIEFVNFKLLQQSIQSDRASPRFDIYYAHPYRSGERGSNENANGFLRRFYPKGTNFAEVPIHEIFENVTWMNNYPRKIHKGKSASELFDREINKCKRAATRLAEVA